MSSSLSLSLGVLAALAAAVLYSAGVALQSIEAREAPSEDSLKLSLLRRLASRRRWQIGTACVAGGWAMQAVALLIAPITIGQPALAISVVSLLVIAMRWFGERAGAREVNRARPGRLRHLLVGELTRRRERDHHRRHRAAPAVG